MLYCGSLFSAFGARKMYVISSFNDLSPPHTHKRELHSLTDGFPFRFFRRLSVQFDSLTSCCCVAASVLFSLFVCTLPHMCTHNTIHHAVLEIDFFPVAQNTITNTNTSRCSKVYLAFVTTTTNTTGCCRNCWKSKSYCERQRTV